jgi:sirohydrochlorin cobaltochelatase
VRKQAVIVAHGWPKYPAVAEAELAWLAARVSAELGDWDIRSATLAAPLALEKAVGGTDPEGAVLIYPFFMSDGWFVTDYLRKRVESCVPRNLVWCTPFGLDDRMLPLCETLLETEASQPETVTLVVVAHGSPDNPRPAAIARDLTVNLSRTFGFKASRTGFVDEAPFLDEVLAVEGPAICLPFFATRAGHVREDLPAALAKTGFAGTVLPPVGTVESSPMLVAKALAERLEASGQTNDD